MIFKRVLHPVGQGAFFTEQFYDENDVNIFTVTYDCGEKNSNKHLEREIDNTLYPTGQPVEIDLMFISHLDEDHISGIEYLVKIKSLTSRSVVILPLHYPLVVKLMLQQLRDTVNGQDLDDVSAGLLSLFDSGAKILGIEDNGEEFYGNALSIDESQEGIAPYSAVKSMQPLQYKNLWYYLPFNTILDDNRYQKFEMGLQVAQIDKNRLSDINYVKDNLDTLIDIYSHLPKSIGGVTPINVNSLNVISYSAKDLEVHEVWTNYFGMSNCWWYPWYDELVFESRCSCLYTGDCVMEVHFDKCLDSIVKYVLPQIGMLQIPHHGHATCYNKATVHRDFIRSGYTNFNSTHKANKFVKQIVHDFSVMGKMFFQITEHFHSRLELYVKF